MKRYCGAMLLSAVMLLCLVGCLVAKDPLPSLDLLLAEDFEQVPVGEVPTSWLIIDGTPVVTDELASTRSLRLEPNPEAGANITQGDRIYVLFTPQDEVVEIEFDLYLTSEVRGLVVSGLGEFDGENQLETRKASIENAGPYLIYTNDKGIQKYDGSFKTIGYYTANQWMEMKLKIDVAAESYTLFIDGVPCEPAGFRTSHEVLTGIAFSVSGTANAHTVYIDNLKVWGKEDLDEE